MTFDELCGALGLTEGQKTVLNHWFEEHVEDRVATESCDALTDARRKVALYEATLQRIEDIITPFGSLGDPTTAALAYAIGKISVIMADA